ncbi:MAG: dihydroxy-acid dehydratase [Chitinophagaceae bacterium]
MPGCIIAMGRLNRPALMIYGGTIKPGHSHEQTLDIISAFQSYGAFIAGNFLHRRISRSDHRHITFHSFQYRYTKTFP